MSKAVNRPLILRLLYLYFDHASDVIQHKNHIHEVSFRDDRSVDTVFPRVIKHGLHIFRFGIIKTCS